MKCPRSGCRKKATVEHFRESAECLEAAATIGGMAGQSRRVNISRAGGRPAILRTCPKCGIQCGTAAMRKHKCEGMK